MEQHSVHQTKQADAVSTTHSGGHVSVHISEHGVIALPAPLPHGTAPKSSSDRRKGAYSMEWLKILLRSLSLQILSKPKQSVEFEKPKVAIHQSRRKAFIRLSIHFLPVFGCLCLIYLNWRSTYILRDSSWFSALAFVSKLHEILMQASIGAMLATWIRRELLCRKGLPLGGLFAISQAVNPSYLWSLEFWGSLSPIKFRRMQTWRPLSFAAVVVISVLLGSAVGPASNIAMLPRNARFLLGSSVIRYAKSDAEMFPTTLDAQTFSPNDAGEPIFDEPNDYDAIDNLRDILGTNYLSDQVEAATELGGASVWRQLKLWTKPGGDVDTYTGNKPWDGMLVATTSPSGVSATVYLAVLTFLIWTKTGLTRLRDIRAEHTMETKTPYVSCLCITTTLPMVDGIYIKPDTNPMREVVFRDFKNGTFVTELSLDEPHMTAFSNGPGRLLWMEPPSNYKNEISVTGLIVAPNITAACSIKAVWGNTVINITSDGNLGFDARPTVHTSPFSDRWTGYNWTEEVVTISPRWMDQILPAVKNTENNTTANSSIKHTPVVPEYISHFLNATERAVEESRAEEYLSSLVAAGMSRVNNEWDLLDRTLHYWYMQDYCNASDPTHTGGFHLGHCGQLLPLPEGHVEFRLDTNLVGQGYSLDDTPTYLALSILALYCSIVCAHVIYTMWTGVSSNSWDSMAEITALALNSQIPQSLRHATAGISNMRTFSQPVAIRTRNHQNLELVFLSGDTKYSAPTERLEKNKEY